jgi:uncharacterized protein (TIGR00251 family)
VTASARQNQLQDVQGDHLRVRVAAPPEKGAANRVLVRFLAETLQVARSSVEIVKGPTSRSKLVALSGIPLDEAKARLGIP